MLTDQILLALRRIIRAIDLHSQHLIHRYDLTVPQLVVLKELAAVDDEAAGLSVSTLAGRVHLSHATVTGILSRLERRRLVARQRSIGDRRRVLVKLTEAGHQLLQHGPSLLQDTFVKSFHDLADWQRTQILSSLQHVVSMMEATELDATPMLATGPLDASAAQSRAFLTDESTSPSTPTTDGDDAMTTADKKTKTTDDTNTKGAAADVCSKS